MKLINKQLLVCLIILNSFLYISTSLLTVERKKSTSKTKQYNSRTPANDWGQGNVYYLDRHSVDCGRGRVLQGFHLTRPSGNTISYEFACMAHPTVTYNVYNGQTGWNATNGGNPRHSTNYLDRHNVACRPGFALQQFRLIRNGPTMIAYQYRCVEVKNSNSCMGGSTGETYGNRVFENIYLDRQRIFVGGDRFLTSFKLNTRYGWGAVYYRYGYGSCRFGANAPAQRNNPRRPNPPRYNPPRYNPPRRNNNAPRYNPPRRNNYAPRYNPPRRNNYAPRYNPPRRNNNSPRYNPPRRNNYAPRHNNYPARHNNAPRHNNYPARHNNYTPRHSAHLPARMNVGPHDTKAERKLKVQEGNRFCSANCIPNRQSKEKKCWKKGVKSCNSCQFRDPRNAFNNRDAADLCMSACNSIAKTNVCAYYPYIDDKKKIINQRLLSKFGLRLFRKYLKRFLK